MAPAYATYDFFIDWDGDGGLRLNDFQNVMGGWQAHGTTPPDLELSDAQAFQGSKSLLITWHEFLPFTFDDEDLGFDEGQFGVDGLEATPDPFTFDDDDLGFNEGAFGNEVDPIEIVSSYVTVPLENLIPGKIYTFSMYLRPVGTHVYYKIDSLVTSAPTTALDEWQQIEVQFVPTSASHTIAVHPSTLPDEGDELFVDYMTVRGQFEKVVPQNQFSFSYGRDDSRALSPVSPADTELEFLDLHGRYSPLNTNSELYPNVEAGREVAIRANYNGRFYDLFWGLLDNVELNPATGEQSVEFEIVDIMSFVGQTKLDTEVYSGKRTGELIHIILDEIGWPEARRDIDPGATWVDRWWAYDTDASSAISDLVASEGLPAYAMLAPSGDFVFRDRHHRLLSDRSNTVQATIAASGDEPLFSSELSINLGWKDVINTVRLETSPRRGEEYYQLAEDRVWSYQGIILVPPGETEELRVVADSAFIHARDPVDNSNPFQNRHGVDSGDYTLLAGSVNVYLSRRSGQTTSIFIQNTGVVTAVIQDMSLYAIPIVQREEEKRLVFLQDTAAIDRTKRESSHDIQAPWANFHDCQAISQIVLGQRANKLPTVSFTLNNGSEERLTQILERQLGDRIRVKEPRSFIDNEFFIEAFEHDVDAAGKYHKTIVSCEQVPVYADSDEANPVPAFTFDNDDAGFDEGVFGYDGVSDADSLFVLDQTNLNEGLLAF